MASTGLSLTPCDGPFGFPSSPYSTAVDTSASLMGSLHHSLPQRIGEALHPGPPFWIGTSNPSGPRNKEQIYYQLPEGVWGVSETHVAAPGLRSTRAAFQLGNRNHRRNLSFLPGAPVALRPGSTTAGTWSGVATVSDASLRHITLPWPTHDYSLGRVQMLECSVGACTFTGCNLYGWPSGPTYPAATTWTDNLVRMAAQELGLSRRGYRFLVGDFNHTEHSLSALRILRSLGWIEIQEWGAAHLGWVPRPTCKGSSFVDQVGLSPQCLPLIKGLRQWPLFSEHTVLGVSAGHTAIEAFHMAMAFTRSG